MSQHFRARVHACMNLGKILLPDSSKINSVEGTTAGQGGD